MNTGKGCIPTLMETRKGDRTEIQFFLYSTKVLSPLRRADHPPKIIRKPFLTQQRLSVTSYDSSILVKS